MNVSYQDDVINKLKKTLADLIFDLSAYDRRIVFGT